MVYAHLRGVRVDRVPPDELQQVKAFYRRHYRECMFDRTVVFPGVKETLQELASTPKAISTSKPMEYAEPIIDHFSLRPHFRAIVGCEDIPTKPDPAVF